MLAKFCSSEQRRTKDESLSSKMQMASSGTISKNDINKNKGIQPILQERKLKAMFIIFSIEYKYSIQLSGYL